MRTHTTSPSRQPSRQPGPAFVPTMFSHSLGGELAAMRIRAGISPKTMAAHVGVSPDELEAIEAGRKPILTDLLVHWCAVVDADPGRALNRATRYTPPPAELLVDVALLKTGVPETGGWFKVLAAWAEATFLALPDPESPVVTLSLGDLERLARDFRVSVHDLVMTLGDFTPLEPSARPY